jgi:hypothetical protein
MSNYIHPSDQVNPEVWDRAIIQMRKYPGMAGIYLKRNPYTCEWIFKIDWSDSSKYERSDGDINKAILGVVEAMERDADKLRALRFKID